jgi:hypothetical protein
VSHTKRAVRAGEQHEPPPPARTVKPNRRTHTVLPVVAIAGDADGNYLSESGETGSVSQLIDELPKYAPTLFCTVGAADFVAMLDEIYSPLHPNSWQRIYGVDAKDVTPVNGVARAARCTTPVNLFGWKDRDGGVFHRIIDPVTMYRNALGDIWPGEDDDLRKLLKWGIALRDFCAEQNLRVSPVLGGMAAQLLRDPRFYPNDRRKVPTVINERARETMPGNHYFLNVLPDPSNNFTAHYLDQHRAHHYHARHTPLPDSNNCFAYGRFTDLGDTSFRDCDPRFMGLYCLDLDAPRNRPPFDFLGSNLDAVFVYSNELPYLLDSGFRVTGVRAAWGSVKRDVGIAKYAGWACDQLDRYDNAAWLKPLLLATYGVLATRPMTRKAVFRMAKKGTPVTFRTGRRKVSGLYIETPRKLQPGVAHVIQLGMIQAATRVESIGLAQWLDFQGYTVLSIHSDSVHVEADDDKPLPEFIPEPWRCKTRLTYLQYISEQAFLSNQMKCLPGVSGQELRRYTGQSNRAPRFTAREVSAREANDKPVEV